ncbi:hypothetical protein [Streptomyces subrutilus]|uniref:Uncharacterized protein n=1 Tax=Streptomyces subrutilus TaxID=36818 RepID=A0A1E5PZK4_9ACTN|nr:hypothetical protein [Streptomyces subrutilus]OEJ35078.1 hypothetical protein BGK67_30520 [Streptomyces subrutilus]
MHNFGLGEQRGHVLLIAGDAAVRRRGVQVAPSANLAALGVVPASGLLNSGVPCDTTYLDGARDPNTVLMRLRTAAATPGPLLVYLSGRLTVDGRGNRLHLALAGTTAGTVRYTALPWEWLGAELRDRPVGLTTVLLDLAADKAAWPLLQEYGSLPASPSAEVYGVVCPPGWHGGGPVVSGYTRAWIDQLRASPTRPGNLRLHALAVGAAALPPGALVLPGARELAVAAAPGSAAPGVSARSAYGHVPGRVAHLPAEERRRVEVQVPLSQEGPATAPPDDPRPHIHGLATAGRHSEAALLARAWEEYVHQTQGPASREALHWVEIRADLARMAGDFRLATELWSAAARARLGCQAPDAADVHAAAAGALYCWTQLKDPRAALETGPDLIRLLRELPALDPRHLELAQHRLEYLHRAPSRP